MKIFYKKDDSLINYIVRKALCELNNIEFFHIINKEIDIVCKINDIDIDLLSILKLYEQEKDNERLKLEKINIKKGNRLAYRDIEERLKNFFKTWITLDDKIISNND